MLLKQNKTQSIRTNFGFHLELTDQDGVILWDCLIPRVDLERAKCCVTFDAVRRGILSRYIPHGGHAVIEPIFVNDHQSAATGFRVDVEYPAGQSHSVEFPTRYFKSAADRARAQLVREQVINSDDELLFRLTAVLDDQPDSPAAKFQIVVESIETAIPIHPGRRQDYGPTESWDSPADDDLPVLVDREVLRDTVEEASDCLNLEIAGFLFGQLISDETTHETFLVVTGLGSCAGTTRASGHSVTFTPESFAKGRELLQLRGGRELIVGWYHSHPFRFCAECPFPTPAECVQKVLFYSLDDIHVMETTFDQPFMVGLLVGIEPRLEPTIGHLPVKLYGWSAGEIRARGFQVADVNFR